MNFKFETIFKPSVDRLNKNILVNFYSSFKNHKSLMTFSCFSWIQILFCGYINLKHSMENFKYKNDHDDKFTSQFEASWKKEGIYT